MDGCMDGCMDTGREERGESENKYSLSWGHLTEDSIAVLVSINFFLHSGELHEVTG